MFKGRKIPSDFRLNIPPFSDIAAGLNWKLKCTVIIHKGKSVSHLPGRRIYPSTPPQSLFVLRDPTLLFFNYYTHTSQPIYFISSVCKFQFLIVTWLFLIHSSSQTITCHLAKVKKLNKLKSSIWGNLYRFKGDLKTAPYYSFPKGIQQPSLRTVKLELFA